MSDEIHVSSDPETIRGWASECLTASLYRGDGVAQNIFRGESKIHKMAYIPGKAWVMHCDWPERYSQLPSYQAFTLPELRRHGYCERLCRAINPEWFVPLYDAKAKRRRAG